MFTPARKIILLSQPDYITLPQNLLTNPGTLLEDYETIADWTVVSGTVTANAIEYKTGTKSVKFDAVTGIAVADKSPTWVIDGTKNMRLMLYRHTVGWSGGELYLATDGTWAKYWINGTALSYLREGWNALNITPDAWVANGGIIWADMITKFRNRVGYVAQRTGSIDSFVVGVVALPAVILAFDDGSASCYTKAFNYMRRYNMVGTAYVVQDLIGIGGYMTSTQLQAMDHSGGWAIANHTKDHAHLPTLTEAQQETELTSCRDWLNGLGLTRGSLHVGYPYGEYNADTMTAMAATGMLTGRMASTPQRNPVLPYGDNTLIEARQITDTTSLATAKGYIDTAIARSEIAFFFLHNIVDVAPGAGEWLTSDFQALIDYIVTKKNQIYPITIDDFYRLSLGPVNVRKVK